MLLEFFFNLVMVLKVLFIKLLLVLIFWISIVLVLILSLSMFNKFFDVKVEYGLFFCDSIFVEICCFWDINMEIDLFYYMFILYIYVFVCLENV